MSSVKTVVENFVHDIVVLMFVINVLLLLRKGKMGGLRSAMSKSTRPKKNRN
jgi:preprotein translocase subunit SecG